MPVTRAVPALGASKERWDVHAVYVPELHIDTEKHAGQATHQGTQKGTHQVDSLR